LETFASGSRAGSFATSFGGDGSDVSLAGGALGSDDEGL